MNETVLSIDDGGVCVITLNRPARLNAINPAFTYLLALQVGPARAREMLYTSRKYTAAELLDCGLASEVVPADRLLDTAIARAQALAALPVPVRRALKRALVDPHRTAIEAALEAEAAAVVATMRDPSTYARIERESERVRKEALREEYEDPRIGAWDRVRGRWIRTNPGAG